MFADYLQLTKPRMVAGNMLVAFAAFIFGSPAQIDWATGFVMLAGLALVIGSACTFNNYFDRDIDARMERTRTRVLAANRIPSSHALVLGSVLFVLGIILLSLLPTTYPLLTALVGWISYVCFYTPLKHHSGLSLFIGALAGATPPVVGYTAAGHTFDSTALILFVLLFMWQVPHFLAISVYRFDEYKAAEVPLLIKKLHPEHIRHGARKIFFGSLVILLVGCAGLVLWHFAH